MEIEKKRETSWKIRLKQNNKHIEITSVEISGEVRHIEFPEPEVPDKIAINLSELR